MPKVSPIQTNFNTGEVTPLLYGRVDSERYSAGLAVCKNYVPTLQGGLIRRSGTRFVAEVKTSSKATRILPFEYSTEQAYVLELGDQYIRFYKDNGRIEVATVPVEIATPYLEADLDDLKFTQSADILYIVHKDYEPRKLIRTSDTVWSLDIIDILDGPYLSTNLTTTTLTPSSFAVGTGVTLTASSTTGINDDTGFQLTDVGRSIRLKEGSEWGWVEITGYTSTTVVTVEIFASLTDTTSKGVWRMGLWSDTTGYPSTVSFHEDRLVLSGMELFPQRMDMSTSGEYEVFSPTELSAPAVDTELVIDSNALSFSFNAENVNAIVWHVSDEKGLAVGTVGGEWIVRPSSRAEALTPSNITAKRSTSFGSADVQALAVGKASLMIQRSGRKIRELSYNYEVDGFRAPDLTLLSEHITQTGVKALAHQREPQPVLWCVRNDGQLIGLTYERNVESFQAGWHRHILGGESDAGGTQAKVESVSVIPSPDGTREELWLVVNRYIDGGTKRYIEYMERFFDDEIEQRDAVFVDSSLTYDDPKTISGVTQADPAVVTATGHGFSNGDKVLISGVLGMTELNSNSYLIANVTANTFELTDLSGTDIDSTSYNVYVSGGEVREYISTVTGLDHLEGQTVSILADGAVLPDQEVSSGTLNLTVDSTTVTAGLKFISDGQMLRLDAGSADGTAIGKTRRIHRVGVMFHRSLGLKVGMNFDDLTQLTFRTSADPLTRAPALFTGIRSETVEADYDFENQISWRQDQPLPSMILAIMPQMHTQDR